GERIGASREQKTVWKVSAMNAIYTSIIYVIVILIIYLILKYGTQVQIWGTNIVSFAEFVVVVPIAIVLVLIPLIAALSAARHAGA
ncbi:MAG: hypothetical protein M1504_00090, partial [Candidatus Marsarchaeota archaeon]|nr:hypothetical protein [Candidatus Marsarchaeota archaeon]